MLSGVRVFTGYVSVRARCCLLACFLSGYCPIVISVRVLSTHYIVISAESCRLIVLSFLRSLVDSLYCHFYYGRNGPVSLASCALEDWTRYKREGAVASLESFLHAIYYLSPHSYLHTSAERRCDRTKKYLELEIDRDQEGNKEDDIP